MGNDAMKSFVGCDIIEVERIRKSVQDENFRTRVFTEKELEYCNSKGEKTKYQHYAARFAGKEAVFKAISNLLNDKYDIGWKDIEILNDENGRPIAEINDSKYKNYEIDISLSHIKEYAMATAIVNEKQGD